MLNSLLNTIVNYLVNIVSINILSKRELESNNIVAIYNSNKLRYNIFEKLR